VKNIADHQVKWTCFLDLLKGPPVNSHLCFSKRHPRTKHFL